MPMSSSAEEYTRPKPQYDFARFDTAPAKKKKNQAAQRLKVVATPARQRRAAQMQKLAVNAAVSLILLVGLSLVMLYSQAVLATVNENISAKTEVLNTLNGEYTRLQTELEGKISLRNIEEYAAANLGMSKVEQGQVQYVNVEQGESVTLYNASKESNVFEQFQKWVSKIVGHIQEAFEIG